MSSHGGSYNGGNPDRALFHIHKEIVSAGMQFNRLRSRTLNFKKSKKPEQREFRLFRFFSFFKSKSVNLFEFIAIAIIS